MNKTSIEWPGLDVTWNPLRGCSPARGSEQLGCRECYAAATGGRFIWADKEHTKPGAFSGFVMINGFGQPLWTGKVGLLDHKVDEPLHHRAPSTIFVCSMSDLFHETVSDEWLDRIFAVMLLADYHTYMILTKRSRRALKYWNDPLRRKSIEARMECYPGMPRGRSFPRYSEQWPPKHLRFGVSCENQPLAEERLPDLMKMNVAFRFASYEPALGSIDFGDWIWPGCWTTKEVHDAEHAGGLWCDERSLDLLIAGGESQRAGQHARESELDWFRSARDQCAEAGVAYQQKQITRYGKKLPFESWPKDLQVRV